MRRLNLYGLERGKSSLTIQPVRMKPNKLESMRPNPVISINSKILRSAFVGLIVWLGLIFDGRSALAMLPPHGPTFALPDTTDGTIHRAQLRSGDSSRADLFLLKSNPKERIEAQVQISTLNDKINHLEDPSFIVPDVDSKRFLQNLFSAPSQ